MELLSLDGKLVIPCFIDAHMHCESTLLPPSRTAFLAEFGTAVCITDPHEITNVLGKKGFELFLEDSDHSLVDFRFTIPSCVPATPFETAGGNVTGELVRYTGRRQAESAQQTERCEVLCKCKKSDWTW